MLFIPRASEFGQTSENCSALVRSRTDRLGLNSCGMAESWVGEQGEQPHVEVPGGTWSTRELGSRGA